MQRNRLNHLKDSHLKYAEKISSKTQAVDYFNSDELEIRNRMNEFHGRVMQGDKLNAEEIVCIKEKLDLLHEMIMKQFANAEDRTQKALVAKKFQMWIYICVGMMLALEETNEYETCFKLGHPIYKKIKTLMKMIDRFPEEDQKIYEEVCAAINTKQYDLTSAFGKYYFTIKEYHHALAYYSESLLYLEESNYNSEWKLYLKATVFLNIAETNIEFGHLDAAIYFAHQCNCILHVKSKDDIKANQYLRILSKIIIFCCSESGLNRLETIINDLLKIFPEKKYNPELYFNSLHLLIENLLPTKKFLLALPLLSELTQSKIKIYETYGKKCITFIKTKNWKAIKTWQAKQISQNYPIALNEATQTLDFTISKPILDALKKSDANYATYAVRKIDNKQCILQVPATISTDALELLAKKVYASQQLSTSTEPKQNEIYQQPSISQLGKTEIKDIDNNNVDDPLNDTTAEKKTKIKTRKADDPTNNDVKESKQEVEEVSLAEQLGFNTKFKNEKIYPIYSHVHPNNTLWGFYSRENTDKKIAEEIHDKCEAILEIGRVGRKAPCIKFVKGMPNTFKLAPLYDFRMFSQEADRSKDGKILLSFNMPYTHEEQKKLLNNSK